MTSNRLFSFVLCLLAALSATAQPADERTLTIGMGSANLLDTYISQEQYTGSELRLTATSGHWLKKNNRWHRLITHSAQLQQATPRADNVDYLGGLYTFRYALRRAWTIADQWHLEVGGQAELGLGFLYNTRNSNNPAQARIYLNVAPTARAARGFHLFGKHLTVGYELSVPLLGLLFSPNYGQSYYEIFSQGNYDHNIVPTTPVCAPSLRHELTLDIPLRRASLRLGYMGDVEQARVNDLKTHSYSHLFLIGYVKSL